LISPEVEKSVLRAFRSETSQAHLQLRTCCVCQESNYAREMHECAVGNIPNVSLLEREGQSIIYLGDKSANGDVLICPSCMKKLNHAKKPEPPKNSIFYTPLGGDLPEELKDLTFPEQMMISPIMCKAYVIKLVSYGHPNQAQRGVKGNCIAFLQDVHHVATTLPDLEAPSKYLQVCFVGDETSPAKLRQVKKVLKVRKEKVLRALEFLCKNHAGFKKLNITIDYDKINQLPDDDIPADIIDNMVLDTDVAQALGEHSSYIPAGNAETIHNNNRNTMSDDVDTNVFYDLDDSVPLDMSCVMDVDSTQVSNESLYAGALNGITNKSNFIRVESGSQPITSWQNPDFWTLAFPLLFPYGTGGCNDETPKLEVWAQHLLALNDNRFRTHYSFMFVVHSILNVRNVCRQTSFSLSRSSIDVHNVTSDELKQALKEVNSGKHPSNPRVAMILQQLRTIGSNIEGSDFRRRSLQYEIRALMLLKGLPSFFVTINPSDLDHPLLLHFAGKTINLDSPLDSVGWLDKSKRAELVAKDPVAAAKFFHTLVEVWLKTVMGITSKGEINEIGPLGRVAAYYGTVETQGRGSLHLHMLFWIHGALSPDDLVSKCSTDAKFNQDVLNYLSQVIKEQYPSGTLPSDLPGDKPVCCSQRPPDPADPEFETIKQEDLAKLVQTCNKHKHTQTCYKYGYTACRFDFPRPAIEIARIENGVIWLQRKKGNGMVNNYNETITLAMRCNTDVKFINSGKDSKALSFYITDYITKKALQSHNAFPLIMAAAKQIEDGIFPCAPNPKYTASRQNNRDMMVKCLNKLTTHSERSGPEVATLLLKKPLHYTDHKFIKLILTPFISEMDGKEEAENFHIVNQEEENELISVNQKLDYLLRSENLSNVCLYDYASKYYKARIPTTKNTTGAIFCFLEGHPQAKTHCLRERPAKSYVVPTFPFQDNISNYGIGTSSVKLKVLNCSLTCPT
jgi:hypothetical protein